MEGSEVVRQWALSRGGRVVTAVVEENLETKKGALDLRSARRSRCQRSGEMEKRVEMTRARRGRCVGILRRMGLTKSRYFDLKRRKRDQHCMGDARVDKQNLSDDDERTAAESRTLADR